MFEFKSMGLTPFSPPFFKPWYSLCSLSPLLCLYPCYFFPLIEVRFSLSVFLRWSPYFIGIIMIILHLPLRISFELQNQSTENELHIWILVGVSHSAYLHWITTLGQSAGFRGKYKKKWLLLSQSLKYYRKEHQKYVIMIYDKGAVVEVSVKGFGSRGGSGLLILTSVTADLYSFTSKIVHEWL